MKTRQVGEESKILWLVPELCRLTGLTDDMRNNFQLMKSIADHTRMVPGKRINALMQFSRRILESKEVNKNFHKNCILLNL
jgi:aubergine